MKIYENSKDPSRRSSNNCGYCRQPGHNRTECPEVAKDWAYFQDFQIPPTVVSTVGIGHEPTQSTGASGIKIVRTPTISSLTLRLRRKPPFSVPLLSVASVAPLTTTVVTVI